MLITVAVAAFGYYVPQWAWGWDMPAGELVWGFIIGSLTALMAFGLALIYKSNKVINFAQADLGAVPASLCVSLITLELWSFWIALPVALIASVALGSFVEFVIIRRFSKAPRLILMVVTVGLAQLLAGLGVAIPFFMGADLPQQTYNPPFDFSFEINPVIFHANDLIAVIATLLSIVGLFAFLRFTSIGIALRASSESSDRASLLGVNVGFTHNIAWVIATLLATISLILRAGIIGLPLGSAFGPAILLRALDRGGDRANGELHRDLPGVVWPRSGRDDRRLEQGLRRARRPDHVRDRDRRAPPAAAEQASPASRTRPSRAGRTPRTSGPSPAS